MSTPDAELGHVSAQDPRRRADAYAVGMIVLLVLFSFGGENGVVYTVSLLGVPIMSGILGGLAIIRFWHAVLGCLAVMVGLAALARWVTRRVVQRRRRPTEPTVTG